MNSLEQWPAITVRVRALVGPEGDIRICAPLDTEAPAAFQKAAMDSVRQCKLAPPRAGGKPVATWITMPVPFAANEKPFNTTEMPDGMTTGVTPRAVSQFPPVYPPDEHRGGREGLVVVTFVVGKTGLVEPDKIDVFRATSRSFAQSAAKAIATWKFNPGMSDGAQVRAWMCVPVAFRLRN